GNAILADHPVAYWRLGEKTGAIAYDLSGNNYHGTYPNNVTLGQAGKFTDDADTSATFAGSHLVTPYQQTAVTAYSVETWVKTTDTGSVPASTPLIQNRRISGASGKSL